MGTASSNSHPCPKSSGETSSPSPQRPRLGRFPWRTADAAASSPSANGDSARYLSLTLRPRPFSPSPSHNPFSSLFPLSSQLSRFPDTILLLLPLSPVHCSPPPLFPVPSSFLHFIIALRPPSTSTATFTILRPQQPPSPFSYSGPDSTLS
ncbi:hypothetical protein OPV22_024294 [Ensete ventricosum]|uniref:Uncharacterized protein n=1 Tax=Ensete ventricosum TaxID=4639 RepID=A0AAV8QNQ9_ENSVE|nr:hypothetical protein OPV22_024294 [Ensete ventricosum]